MCVKTKIRLLFVSLLSTEDTDFTDFLYSFSVKSVPERNHQVYFSICIIPDSKFVHQPITGFPSCNLFNRNNASI